MTTKAFEKKRAITVQSGKLCAGRAEAAKNCDNLDDK